MKKSIGGFVLLLIIFMLFGNYPSCAQENISEYANVEREITIRKGEGWIRFQFVDDDNQPIGYKQYSVDGGITYQVSDEDGYSEYYYDVPQIKIKTKRYYFNNGVSPVSEELLIEKTYPEFLSQEADGTDESEYQFGEYLEIISDSVSTSKTVLTAGDNVVSQVFDFQKHNPSLEVGNLYRDYSPCECVLPYEFGGTNEEGNPFYIIRVVCDRSGVYKENIPVTTPPVVSEDVSVTDNPPVVSQEPIIELSGDTDGNGKVELQDAQFALKAALKINVMDEGTLLRTDVVKDGIIALDDAQKILKMALKIE